jgi:predicted secreted acid phosphatase
MNLEIYDIDETLFKTNSLIYVIKDNEIIKKLTNSEYNSYSLLEGESFDFSEFRMAEKFYSESQPIQEQIDSVKNALELGKEVYFVTARANFDDKELFLDTFRKYGIDIDRIRIERAGNITEDFSGPVKKKIIIRNILRTKKYSTVKFFDDFCDNLKEFYSLNNEFPNTEFTGVLC